MYSLTLRPDNPKDAERMRKIWRHAKECEGGGYFFDYMQLDDEGRKCPMLSDIYTPYGWNELKATMDAFNRGETVWFKVFED